MPTTVILCDDDPIVRDALTAYIDRDPNLDMIATTETADHALELLAEHRVDVVLMDLALPGTDGLEATRQITEQWPQVAVLVLTAFGSDEQVHAALTAGASGFLLKSTATDALIASIHAAASGAGTLLTPELATDILTAHTRETAHGQSGLRLDEALSMYGLTEREVQVLQALCRAESNVEIAARLELSESTVKSHVSSLMTKMGCSSRLQLAVSAFEEGLVTARPSV